MDKNKKAAKHVCKFKPVAAQQHRSGTPFSAVPTTLVLRRCACGEVDSITLAGTWTLHQIKGKEKRGQGKQQSERA